MQVLLAMKHKSIDFIRAKTFISVVYFGLFLLLVLDGLAAAQNRHSDKEELKIPSQFTIPLQGSQGNKALLDKKIDPETYVLGPGDILSLFTWGSFEGQYQLTISPEGMLLVPEMGPIDISGLTLTQARGKVSESINQKYRNVEFTISLVDLRVFKVYIGGAVLNPGAYPATAMTRVSEVIDLAGGLFEGPNAADKTQPLSYRDINPWYKVSSKRNIKVTRQNGEIINADILKLDLAGNPAFDPLLSDGDRIFIPIRESSINLYGIFGAVRNPGYFEYSSRDSLSDLINLAHGVTMDADSQAVEVVRFQADNQQTSSIAVDLNSPGWNIPLKSDDRVYVKPIQGYHEKYQVLLVGEFKYPGYYAITEDSSTLRDIVIKAGGFTDLASFEEAEMTRVSSEELIDPEFERLKKMNVADMSETEYEYFKIKSRSKVGRVAVDFYGLFQKNDLTKNIPLRDNDVISVPRKRQVISVSGEVANPGFLTYVPDKDYIYYIGMAGGYSDRAGQSGVSIIKTSGEWKTARKNKGLDPGDTVLIPEKKKHNYVGTIKDIAVFIGNLATVYLVIRQATK
jgi:protein involved in polysaccharide export with SLBB domain